MSLIQVNNLTFAYEGSYETIFDHVSFRVRHVVEVGVHRTQRVRQDDVSTPVDGKLDAHGSITSMCRFFVFSVFRTGGERLCLRGCDADAAGFELWRVQREMAKPAWTRRPMSCRPQQRLSGQSSSLRCCFPEKTTSY